MFQRFSDGEKPHVTVRQMVQADIRSLLDVQSRAYPGMESWTAEDIEHHLSVFPEGRLVAVKTATLSDPPIH